MFDGKLPGRAQGLEPPLRAGSLYAHGIVPGACMFDGKLFGRAQGLEPPLWAGSLYAHGIVPGPVCLMASDVGSPWAWEISCRPERSSDIAWGC